MFERQLASPVKFFWFITKISITILLGFVILSYVLH